MTNWIIDDLWFEQAMPWFFPQASRMFRSPQISPLNSFRDYMFPVIDRVSSTSTGDSLLDYYHFYSSRFPTHQTSLVPLNSTNKSFSQKYKILNCIGQGGFGQVFDARKRSDNKSVVVKYLPKDRILNWGSHQGKRVPYEIEILWRLRGVAGFIQIFDHFEEPDRFVFAMEKVANSTTLFDFVMNHPPLPNTELLRHLFRELVNLNLTLKLFGIWHRDCKPENILYCRTDRSLRFIDFGSAAPVQSEDFHEFQGTLEIMVPEWILQKRYDGENACVWTLGVCLYFLLFKEYPFRSKTDIVNGRSRLPHQESPDTGAYQTMRHCLHGNEHRRPNLSTLLQLSWLN